MDRFEDLSTFVLVSDLRSVGQAAERLGKAPSAVSRRLKEFEARLGTQLLHRTTRSIRLTDAGEHFVENARQILADLDLAERLVSGETGNLSGRLKLTMPLSFGLRYVSPAINAFLIQHPAIDIDVDLNDRRVDLVNEGHELAIRIGKLPDSSLKSRQLATVRHLVVASPEFWNLHGRAETPQQLVNLPALCYANLDNPAFFRYQSEDGRRGKVKLNPRMLATNGDALVNAAVAGLGVIREPEFLVYDLIASGELEPVLTNYQWGKAGVHVVYPATRYLPSHVRAFIDHLVSWVQDSTPWDASLQVKTIS